MSRKIAIAGASLVVLLAAAFAGWRWLTGPLYHPGDVRAGKGLREPLDPPAQSDPRFFEVAPGIRLHHFEQGQGEPLLVVHGGPGFPPAAPWRAGERLQDRFQLVYYHQRGAGLSTHPFDRLPPGRRDQQIAQLHATLGLPAQLGDLERLRRILGREKLTLVGHSFGALLAALYAAEFPERVEALVLVAPANLAVMPVAAEEDLYRTVRARLPAAMLPAYDAYLQELFDFSSHFTRSDSELAALFGRLRPFYAAATGMPAEAAQASPAAPDGGWMALAIFLGMGRHHDWRPALARVTAPVLVVHGGRDLQPEAASRAFAALFPRAQVAVVPDASHFVFDDAPDEFARVVRQFLVQNR